MVKNPMRRIYQKLESISCLCAEGPEFMGKLQITDAIQKEVHEALEICRSVLQPVDSTGLIKDIRHKQVLTGEQAVVDNLKKLGLISR